MRRDTWTGGEKKIAHRAFEAAREKVLAAAFAEFKAKAAAATTPSTWQGNQPQLSGKRVLVVDDNSTYRRLIAHRAGQWGMRTETVPSGREALKLLAQGEVFDSVVLDLQMPEMDGLTLAQEIRRLPGGRSLPLLLL